MLWYRLIIITDTIICYCQSRDSITCINNKILKQATRIELSVFFEESFVKNARLQLCQINKLEFTKLINLAILINQRM